MYRSAAFAPLRHYHHQPHRCREAWGRMLTALTLWICVSVTLRYGYSANSRMVLGPGSSRLFEASPAFSKQVEVRDGGKKGVFLHWFSERPELSLEKRWTLSQFLTVLSYSGKGFSLWLNQGSSVRIRWEAMPSSLAQLELSLIKGERKYEKMRPTSVNSEAPSLHKRFSGREAEYVIEEDDKYYIGIANPSPISTTMAMNVSVVSKMYSTSKARGMCSTIEGSCRLNLLFPTTQFLTVTTPNNGDFDQWSVELYFIARVVAYIALLGVIVIVMLLILNFLGVCGGEAHEEAPAEREAGEADPLIPEKTYGFPYGTGKEDDESGSSSASEDLYDGKICVICYDEPRNCFFVPCGHCATCHSCAQRIMDGETKVCPICRRLIHKVRKLLIP